ncbi:hypothetical protein Hanom_Chr08g00732591 [Helianthus anomalus]
MHPHNRPFAPNNPYAYQENNPSPPPTRPMARPFFIHSSMPDMAGYASYIGNRVFTNFQQSQHSTLGNSQHRTYLWQGVSKIFHEELGKEVYRENDSLSSKWTEISGQLTKYSGFLNKAKQNPKSGETEADIVTNALLQFKTNVGTNFRFMHCWEICKFHPKWANIPSGSESNTSSKRSRASSQSDARDQKIEDLFDDSPSPNRPEYGRDATKGVLKNQDLLRHHLQLGVRSCIEEYTATSWMPFHPRWIHSTSSNNKGSKFGRAKKLEMPLEKPRDKDGRI